jgi:copper chaperone
METTELKIEGMTCGGCVKSVTRVLTGVAGVASADVSLEEGRARVTFDPGQTGVEALRQVVERAGYKAA